MKTFEAIIRFIGCLIVCYFISAVITGITYALLNISEFTGGVMVGGGTFGSMVYYYQRRKAAKNNFVQSC